MRRRKNKIVKNKKGRKNRGNEGEKYKRGVKRGV